MNKPETGIKRSSKGMRPLIYAINPITKKVFGKKSSVFGQMILQWNTITKGLGCEYASPIKIIFPKGKNNGATLHLSCTSSHALSLQMITPQIIQRINQFFGYNAVTKINFIHKQNDRVKKNKMNNLRNISSKVSNKIEEDLAFIENNEMKKALVALGKSVIHKGMTDSHPKQKDT